MVDYTPILRLVQPDFDQTPWDEDVNNNFAVLDAAYGKFIGIPGLTGAWQNSTSYVVGQAAVDTIDSTLWTCAVSHTSAASPVTFAQDRATHPSNWTSSGALLVYLPITGGILQGNLIIQQPAGVSSTKFNVSTSGASIYSDANYTYFLQDDGQWRWQYIRANGTTQYLRGSDSAVLFNLDGAGNLTVTGTVHGSNVTVMADRIEELAARVEILETQLSVKT